MSKQGKGGRLPISAKETEQNGEIEHVNDEFDNSLLKVDANLKREFAEKGLAHRWINATQFRNNGNFHQSGWRPYRKQISEEERGSMDFQYGVSPEGYLIRNDLMLAVKPLEQQKRWSENIHKRAERLAGKSEENVSEFQKKARSGGAKAHVGYDEND